jgi:uncharacterized repeat protein (TIGR01451 family)
MGALSRRVFCTRESRISIRKQPLRYLSAHCFHGVKRCSAFVALAALLIGSGAGAYAAPPSAVSAPAPQAVYTVCPAGPPTCDYSGIQAAVDAAGPGDTIKVATGSYSGVDGRQSPPGYTGPSVVTQVVYLSQTLTIRGGYDLTFSEPPDPLANPTTIDAQSLGRAVFIAGAISPTLEGLRLTGGSAAGLGGGGDGPYDSGGGAYILEATATLSNNRVFENSVAAYGGGVFVLESDSIFLHNEVYSNTAGWGGAIFLWDSPGTVIGNRFHDNVVVNAGGALNVHSSNALIVDNEILDNQAHYGGGLRFYASAAIFSENTVSGNTSTSYGGGVHMWISPSTLVGNTIAGNTAGGAGGGLELTSSQATLSDNNINANVASLRGAGLHLVSSPALLASNIISGNVTTDYGGGFYLEGSSATLEANTIRGNEAVAGAGGYLDLSTATLDGNLILANSGLYGGGLYLYQSAASLSNNVVADNAAQSLGSGFFFYQTSPVLVHNTIARNHGGDGFGLRITNDSTVVLSNTILVSHTVGVYAEDSGTALLEGTLWGNTIDWGGPGTIVTGTTNVWGAPAFLDPDAGDYHVGLGSAAIDAGGDAGLDHDLDGQPRPIGRAPDLGADEFPAGLTVAKRASAAAVQPGEQITYTLCLTNNGLLALDATVVDILPGPVTPTGLLTWTFSITPGGTWTATVPVTVEIAYTGPLTNEVAVTTAQGVSGSALCHVLVQEAIAGLVATSDGPTALGSAATLTATVAAGSGVAYAWALGDGTYGSGAVVTHTYPAAGNYAAVVTATNLVSAQATTTHVLVQEVIAGLVATSDGPTALGSATTLTATVAAGSDVAYTWALGDGTYGTGAVVTHTYPAAGDYTAVVTATNSVSTSSATTPVTVVRANWLIFLPLVVR